MSLLTLIMEFTMLATIGDEPTNPVDILAAMASRESGCVTVTDVFVIEEPTQHIQFHVHTDPPSGGTLTWSVATPRFPALTENHAHPRHPEVALIFAELTAEHPQHDQVRANRDVIITCFQMVSVP